MSCPLLQNPNSTVVDGVQVKQFQESLDRNAVCGDPTYLRPTAGGSLLPWLYALGLLILHLPMAVFRVKKWERVQILSVVVAVLTITLKAQQFSSTGLSPDKILVWMPLALQLDFGAMLQIHVLIVEDTGYRPLLKAMGVFFVDVGRKLRAKVFISKTKKQHGEAAGKSTSPLPPTPWTS